MRMFPGFRYVPFVLIASLGLTLAGLAENPIVQTIYTADPAPVVINDTVYLFTGHDEDRSRTFNKMVI